MKTTPLLSLAILLAAGLSRTMAQSTLPPNDFGNALIPDQNSDVVSEDADRHAISAEGMTIYGTRGGPFLPGDYGASTHREKTIYVHVLDWPKDKLILPAMPAKILRASMLGGGKATFTQTDQGIEIFVATAHRNDLDTVVALELDQPANTLAPLPMNEAAK